MSRWIPIGRLARRHPAAARGGVAPASHLLCLAWLGLVLPLQASTAHAQDYGGTQALQNQAAWAEHDATPRDCEQASRSFRARNTLRPSERRAMRRRCLESVAVEAEQKKEQKKSTEREVALGE